ncbi:MAG TPA: hypothetical protein VK978_00420 [Candidatus Saccharimonadales bacterium]|nr:hypothetical protein [Candidatus Saccharimonadales bacterium]
METPVPHCNVSPCNDRASSTHLNLALFEEVLKQPAFALPDDQAELTEQSIRRRMIIESPSMRRHMNTSNTCGRMTLTLAFQFASMSHSESQNYSDH